MTDASLQKIAATYGTPTFVFDTAALQARVRAIQAIWGREIDLCYSIKANPFLLPAMMQVTARLEVCSPGELSLCESLHAADARVIYSGVNKTPVDIARAVADGAILCTGASYDMNMDKVAADTAHIYHLMNLPKAETLPPEAAEGLEKCWRDNGATERWQSFRHVK